MNKQQFLEKIIEHSGLSAEVAEKELDAFIEITSGVIKGNPVTIEDLGTFRLKKGRLSFETDPKLAVEINYKYAGMLPIEVKKSFQQNNDESSENESEQQTVQNSLLNNDDEKVAIGKVREPKKPEPIVLVESQPAEPVIESKPEPANEVAKAEIASNDLETIEPSVETQETKVDSTETTESEKADLSQKSVDEKVTAKVETPKTVSKTGAKKEVNRRKESTSVSVWAIAATVLIVLAIIWALSQNNSSKTEPIGEIKKTESKQTTEPEVQSEKMELNEKEAQGKSDPVNPADLPKEIPVSVSTPTVEKQEVVNDIVNQLSQTTEPFYSVVVYTLSFESRAVQEVDSWIKKKYDAFVKPTKTKAGEMRYYVCIGKFDSFKSAKDFAQTLPAPFNSQFAVKRLTE